MQRVRTLGWMTVGRSERSPFVRVTRARKIRVELADPRTYELDGGACDPPTTLEIRIAPAAAAICVPDDRVRCSGQ